MHSTSMQCVVFHVGPSFCAAYLTDQEKAKGTSKGSITHDASSSMINISIYDVDIEISNFLRKVTSVPPKTVHRTNNSYCNGKEKNPMPVMWMKLKVPIMCLWFTSVTVRALLVTTVMWLHERFVENLHGNDCVLFPLFSFT